MANWCYQTVLVGGSRTDRKKFERDLRATETESEPIHFLYLLSASEQAVLDDRSHDFQIHSVAKDPLTMIYFESAWNPAVDLLRAVSRAYPTLVFGVHYSEEANAFLGWKVFHAGVQVEGEEINTEVVPPHLSDVYDAYCNDEICDDEWYEIFGEWCGNRGCDYANDCADCVTQYATWIRIEARREKEGKYPREFVYEPQ